MTVEKNYQLTGHNIIQMLFPYYVYYNNFRNNVFDLWLIIIVYNFSCFVMYKITRLQFCAYKQKAVVHYLIVTNHHQKEHFGNIYKSVKKHALKTV